MRFHVICALLVAVLLSQVSVTASPVPPVNQEPKGKTPATLPERQFCLGLFDLEKLDQNKDNRLEGWLDRQNTPESELKLGVPFLCLSRRGCVGYLESESRALVVQPNFRGHPSPYFYEKLTLKTKPWRLRDRKNQQHFLDSLGNTQKLSQKTNVEITSWSSYCDAVAQYLILTKFLVSEEDRQLFLKEIDDLVPKLYLPPEHSDPSASNTLPPASNPQAAPASNAPSPSDNALPRAGNALPPVSNAPSPVSNGPPSTISPLPMKQQAGASTGTSSYLRQVLHDPDDVLSMGRKRESSFLSLVLDHSSSTSKPPVSNGGSFANEGFSANTNKKPKLS
ncbi:hypothetical protein C8R42DRAFT_371986 [Lentinula raphanica]|nr:hypothetical protein C8R42DRAFT_371986 [Lentinula raphanica]